MANYKRKKSRRTVVCTMCTAYRWMGNAKGRFKAKDRGRRSSSRRMLSAEEE